MVSNHNIGSSDRTQNNASTNNGNGHKVTEAQAERLREMLDRLNKRTASGGSGNYLKLKDGENKRLQFDIDKFTEEDVAYPSNPNKLVHRVKFQVREILNGKTSDTEEEWTTSVTTSKSILKWLAKGYNQFDVSRTGSDKNNTRYEVDPVL